MNNTVKKELEKVRVRLPEYNDNTTTMFIPKSGNPFRIGGSYLIKVPDYIINEPPNFTLSSNWNQGRKPVRNILYAQYIQKLGSMIQFNLYGWDTIYNKVIDTEFYKDFWLPEESITILQSY